MRQKEKQTIASAKSFCYFVMKNNTSEVMINNTATTAVPLARIPSMLLALFLPKKVSAPPAIEPERPCCAPDWKRTIAISTIASTTCTIVKINSNTLTPPNKSKCALAIVPHFFSFGKRYFKNIIFCLNKGRHFKVSAFVISIKLYQCERLFYQQHHRIKGFNFSLNRIYIVLLFFPAKLLQAAIAAKHLD